MKKIKVGILFGGKSAEHEVSVQSAKNVYNSLDKNKYNVTLIGIDKKGDWHRLPEQYLLQSSFGKPLIPMAQEKTSGMINTPKTLENQYDVVFPVLHGPFGEDGSMQGLLKQMNLPFVGAGVLGSAVAMDKDMTKRLLRDAGLPIAKFLVFRIKETIEFATVKKQLGLPFFVKPANLGSSIGVTKVAKESEFLSAIREAFIYDTKILIEEYISGKEVECSVLGNEHPIVSIPGEIIANNEFYDYSAKYDEDGMQLQIPANIPQKAIQEIQTLAIKTFQVLCLDGMARVDFFVADTGKIYINEANTIPGFTNTSVYPKLWEASGIGYDALIEKLITLAIEKFTKQQSLQSSL